MSSSDAKSQRQVVVTGIGAVSAWGWGVEALWAGLASGRTKVSAPYEFSTAGHRTRIVGEVPPPPPRAAEDYPAWHRYSRADRFAVVAAAEACRQASLTPSRGAAAADSLIGVFFGSSTGGMAEAEEFFARLSTKDGRRAPLRLIASHQINNPGDAVARWLGATGPVQTFSSACASAAQAIGAAFDAVRSGEVDIAVAGGADALCQLTYAGFNALRVVDPQPCRPFRRQRAGMNLGEGAGVLVLEAQTGASQRRSRPLATMLGAATTCDAYHMTAPHPRGEGAAMAMAMALGDAEIDADKIDFINSHGTGTPRNDASEGLAIADIFCQRATSIPVTSTKGSVGHLLGASGAVEAVATVQCLLTGEVHVTPGDGDIDEDLAIDLVTGHRRQLAPSAAAVSTSFGFGGANAALVLAAWPRETTP